MPTGRNLHIDVPLSKMSVAAFQNSPDYVAQKIFPVVPVGKQSNKYYTLDQDSWMLVPRTYRAPKTRANRGEFKVSSDAYFADNYAFGTSNALEDLDNADDALQLRATGTEYVTDVLLRDLEIRAVSKVQASVSSITRLATAGTTWDAVGSADIITPVRNAKQSIYNNTGVVPNSIILDWQTYDYASRNELAWAKLQYTQDTGQLTLNHLKQLWDVQNIYIASGRKNNAREAATASYTSIWGPTCLVYYVPPVVNTLKAKTYGVGMRWTPGGFPAPMQVSRQVFSGAGTANEEVLEASYYQDEKVVASALGLLINTKSGTPW